MEGERAEIQKVLQSSSLNFGCSLFERLFQRLLWQNLGQLAPVVNFGWRSLLRHCNCALHAKGSAEIRGFVHRHSVPRLKHTDKQLVRCDRAAGTGWRALVETPWVLLLHRGYDRGNVGADLWRGRRRCQNFPRRQSPRRPCQKLRLQKFGDHGICARGSKDPRNRLLCRCRPSASQPEHGHRS